MTWPFGRQTPDTNLMRFVSRRFLSPATFLDIGSGEGANARELRIRGHDVITIDRDYSVPANYNEDITEWDGNGISYDCVYDINTLCHVKDPPFEKIKGWLKPDGVFFSICPQSFTEGISRIKEGKEYTRFVSREELLHELLTGFSKVEIWGHQYPDFLGHIMKSWIIEAKKASKAE